MKITPEELSAKRARTAHLRAEISSLQAEDVATRREREMVAEAAALDAEIEALEIKVVDAAKASGGTVEDAKAAMQRAADIEKMMLPAPEEESGGVEKTDDDDEGGVPTKFVEAPDEDDEEVPAESVPTEAIEPAAPAFGPGAVRPDLNDTEEGSR